MVVGVANTVCCAFSLRSVCAIIKNGERNYIELIILNKIFEKL